MFQIKDSRKFIHANFYISRMPSFAKVSLSQSVSLYQEGKKLCRDSWPFFLGGNFHNSASSLVCSDTTNMLENNAKEIKAKVISLLMRSLKKWQLFYKKNIKTISSQCICPSGNCPVGELSGRGIVRVGIVRVGNCPSGNCPSGNCPSGNCPVGELSGNQIRWGKFYRNPSNTIVEGVHFTQYFVYFFISLILKFKVCLKFIRNCLAFSYFVNIQIDLSWKPAEYRIKEL